MYTKMQLDLHVSLHPSTHIVKFSLAEQIHMACKAKYALTEFIENFQTNTMECIHTIKIMIVDYLSYVLDLLCYVCQLINLMLNHLHLIFLLFLKHSPQLNDHCLVNN